MNCKEKNLSNRLIFFRQLKLKLPKLIDHWRMRHHICTFACNFLQRPISLRHIPAAPSSLPSVSPSVSPSSNVTYNNINFKITISLLLDSPILEWYCTYLKPYLIWSFIFLFQILRLLLGSAWTTRRRTWRYHWLIPITIFLQCI